MSQDIVIKLKTEDKDIESTIRQMQKMGLIDEKNAKEFLKNQKKYSDGYKKQGKEIGKLDKMIKNVGTSIAGAFAVQQIVGFGQEVLETTAEFQKLEAVLTNTLGSQSEAQASLDMIKTFAAETPFSVLELTDSFVKLTNQGFKPTQKEMQKLGDLAASTGKTYDQLAEGIIDAQVGEFERMKEFGIRAEKQGDKVQFTFKGVKTQVDNTAESIQDYILSLGDMSGVSGSMNAISKTLGGQMSNLEDTMDNMKATLGLALAPAFEGLIRIMGNAASGLTDLISVQEDEKVVIERNRAELMTELDVITKGNLSKEAMAVQIKNINSQYGDYLPHLIDEKSSLEDIKKIQDEVNTALQEKIVYMAFEEEFAEILKDEMAAQMGIVQSEVLRTKNAQARTKVMTEAGTQEIAILEGIADAGEKMNKEIVKGIDTRKADTEEKFRKMSEAMGLIFGDIKAKFGKELGQESEKIQPKVVDPKKLEKQKEEYKKFIEDLAKMERKSMEEEADWVSTFEENELKNEKMLRDARIETNLEGDAQEIERLKAKHEDRLLTFDTEAVEYNELVLLAEDKLQQDIDAVNERRVKKNKESNDEQLKDDAELRMARIQGAASELAALGGFFNAVGNLYSQQSQANKVFTLMGIGLDTASAIASLTAASEANPSNAVTFGAAGVGQFIAGMTRIVTNIAAAKQAISTPTQNQFKDGVILLDGEGTETSDSIPAMLSKNESVIKAKQSRKYSELLRAINDDNLDNYIMKNWNFAPNLPNVKSGGDEAWIDSLTQTLGMNGFSGDEIVGALKNNDRNENKRLHLLIDAISKNNNHKSHRK